MNRLITEADEHIKKREFTDAGKCYELAAAAIDDNRKVVAFLKMAAQAYDKSREIDAAARCYLEASQFLEKTKKAECLLDCWRVYVLAIAGYAWDCCFEWRGDDSHDDDHDLNQMLIKERSTEAEKVLREALSVRGVNRKKIIRLAIRECKRRKKQGGWGEGACWGIVTAVTGKTKRKSVFEKLSNTVLEYVINNDIFRRDKR